MLAVFALSEASQVGDPAPPERRSSPALPTPETPLMIPGAVKYGMAPATPPMLPPVPPSAAGSGLASQRPEAWFTRRKGVPS
ncbi:MAG TPA: hypothetical protein DD417_17305 [Elusimicrobia bacterium]|nr:hypothetical protein [Elusimicrobiota bacterium]